MASDARLVRDRLTQMMRSVSPNDKARRRQSTVNSLKLCPFSGCASKNQVWPSRCSIRTRSA